MGFLALVGYLGFIAAAIAGYWWLFQVLWNAVVVGVFHAPWHLSYWQAAGVATLLGIIGGYFRNVSSGGKD